MLNGDLMRTLAEDLRNASEMEIDRCIPLQVKIGR
jgi:hypothetical protein